MSPYFEFGRVLKPQGIKGELKVELYTLDLENAVDLEYVLIGQPDSFAKHEIVHARTDGKFAYFTLKDITNRNMAEKLRDMPIYIERSQAAPLPEGAFYISDLLGLTVSTDKGDVIGKLDDVMQTGAADIYVVHRENGEEFLFPAVSDVFVKRSPEEGVIVLDSNRLAQVSEYDI